MATSGAVARPQVRASRVGYSDPSKRGRWLSATAVIAPAARIQPSADPRGRMFLPVTSKPDFVAQEYELLDAWRDRRTFARLRAQNAGGPKWSFLDVDLDRTPDGIRHDADIEP